MNAAPEDLLQAALDLAAKGFRVFPCYEIGPDGRCSCGRNCTSPGKHPRTTDGFKSATTDETTIRAWWTEHPTSNVAVSTAGLVVLDQDRHGDHDGPAALAELEEVHGRIPEAPEVLTPTQGVHTWLRQNGTTVSSSQSKLAPGVDVRADGGYVLVPPSNHVAGRLYAWNLDRHPDDLDIPTVPAWIVDKLRGDDTSSTLPPAAGVVSSSSGNSTPESRHMALRDLLWRVAPKLAPQEALDLGLGLYTNWGATGRADEVKRLVRDTYQKLQANGRLESEAPPAPLPESLDLYDPSIVPTRPEFAVKNLVRKSGLHLVWAEPSAGKTWSLLRECHELLHDAGRGRLWSHPDLWINRRWTRALWIATEEDAPTLRYKAEWIRRGLGINRLEGELRYLFAADRKRRVTLDDLGELLDRDGPFDAVILDSLTGLRPKTVNGERVRWDVDNDAANEMCLRLRGLATDLSTAIWLVHHTGRDTSKGYRGPTDWWSSADVMFGLVPDGGRTKVLVEKNRDGKRIAPFLLEPTWNADESYTLEYAGAAMTGKLSPTATKVLAFMEGAKTASQSAIVEKVGCSRSTGLEAIQVLVTAGRLIDTGTSERRSPVYTLANRPEVSGEVSGANDGK